MARSTSSLKTTSLGAIAPDATLASPDVYRVIFENDLIRVLDINLKAGSSSEMHAHPAYLVYALTSCKVKFNSMEGNAGDVDIKAGETMWREAETHSAENIGGSDCRALNIEFKRSPGSKRR